MHKVEKKILTKVITNHLLRYVARHKAFLTKKKFISYVKDLLTDIEPAYKNAYVTVYTFDKKRLIDLYINIPKTVFLRIPISIGVRK